MLVISKSCAGFSKGCALPMIGHSILKTHTYRFANLICLRRLSIQTLARLLHSYVVCCSFEPVSGCNHKETWAGCIVSLTTPTSSSFSAARFVASLSLTEKASRVFLASYFLR